MVLKVIDLLPKILQIKGSVVLKIFEGEEARSIFDKVKEMFFKVDISKPPASRGQSSEVYFVCLRYRGI